MHMMFDSIAHCAVEFLVMFNVVLWSLVMLCIATAFSGIFCHVAVLCKTIVHCVILLFGGWCTAFVVLLLLASCCCCCWQDHAAFAGMLVVLLIAALVHCCEWHWCCQ